MATKQAYTDKEFKGKITAATIIGGTGAGDDLTLQTTSNATKGSYIFSEMTSAGVLKNDASGVVTGGHSIGSAEASTDLITGQTADSSPDGAADYVLTYDASASALKKVLLNDLPSGSGGSSTFTGLTDTPSSYTSNGGYYVRVNSGATALEFIRHKQTVVLKVIANGTTLSTGDGKMYFTVPSELNGLDLIDADASVYTASTSGTPTVQIHNVTDAVDMLSTSITIDANEYSSYTAATAPVIDTAHDDVATGDRLRIDVDAAGTGTKGLDVILVFG